MDAEMKEELIAWLDAMPDDVKVLARDFPPGCTVEVEPFVYMFPGELDQFRGQVVGHCEADEESPAKLSVVSLVTNYKVRLDPKHCTKIHELAELNTTTIAGLLRTPKDGE